MIKKLISLSLLIFISVGLMLHDADARRFGGGRSFGASRSVSSFSRSSSHAFSPAASRPATATGNRWLGPLAGLVAGGLLASLFMSNGFANGIVMWLLVGAVLFFLVRMLKTKTQAQPIYHSQSSEQSFTQRAAASFMNKASAQQNYPIGFDEADFLRQAKALFIRMQAAYDKKDLQDIREFTTPAVYAEIQLQCQERGNTENITHVLTIDAELLNVENEAHHAADTEMQTPFASVRFKGLIQEDLNASAVHFTEVWHFNKAPGSLRWLVAGVQQD